MKKSKVKFVKERGKRFDREAVFLLLTCTKNDEFLGDRMMLMQMRTDGRLGFPGGMVDPGENLWQALDREVKEELNYDISSVGLTPFCTHLINPGKKNELATHLFHKEISEGDMKYVIRNSVDSVDFIKENRGNFLMDLMYDNKKYNKKLMKRSRLAKSVREELELVITYFG